MLGWHMDWKKKRLVEKTRVELKNVEPILKLSWLLSILRRFERGYLSFSSSQAFLGQCAEFPIKEIIKSRVFTALAGFLCLIRLDHDLMSDSYHVNVFHALKSTHLMQCLQWVCSEIIGKTHTVKSLYLGVTMFMDIWGLFRKLSRKTWE